MNVLYKLSRQYAREEMTLAVFRSKRRQLIQAVLAGELSEQTAITNIPPDDTQERTQRLDEAAPITTFQEREQKSQNIQTKSSGMKPLILLVIVIFAVVAYLYSNQLKQIVLGDYESVGNEAELNSPQIQPQLLAKWKMVIESSLYENKTAQEFIRLWEQASATEREKFAEALRYQLRIWESDFDKELEVSLTYQIMQTLGLEI